MIASRRFVPVAALAAAVLLVAGAATAAEAVLHPFLAAQPKQAPQEVNLAVEIPAGSFTKYEIKEDGLVHVDRFQSMPVAYPANYGSLTQSLGGDNDPLDVIFYTRAPLQPGTLIKLRAIGVLKMIDGGEVDDKIVAVPTSKIDPTYDDIKSLSDLPKIEQERLQAFFRVYKQLPDGRKKVELNGFEGADVAKGEIKKAFDAYKAQQ